MINSTAGPGQDQDPSKETIVVASDFLKFHHEFHVLSDSAVGVGLILLSLTFQKANLVNCSQLNSSHLISDQFSPCETLHMVD